MPASPRGSSTAAPQLLLLVVVVLLGFAVDGLAKGESGSSISAEAQRRRGAARAALRSSKDVVQ